MHAAAKKVCWLRHGFILCAYDVFEKQHAVVPRATCRGAVVVDGSFGGGDSGVFGACSGVPGAFERRVVEVRGDGIVDSRFAGDGFERGARKWTRSFFEYAKEAEEKNEKAQVSKEASKGAPSKQSVTTIK